MKQTAVEWLLKDLIERDLIKKDDYIKSFINSSFEQAKEIEKQQVIDAFGIGCQVESTRLIGYHDMAEQYYNEQFKKK
jgi:hypothetical protein